jgi:hypothetical protein
MSIWRSSVAFGFFICAMIERVLVRDDECDLLSAFWEFSQCSFPREYSSLPRAALQKTLSVCLAILSEGLLPALRHDRPFTSRE